MRPNNFQKSAGGDCQSPETCEIGSVFVETGFKNMRFSLLPAADFCFVPAHPIHSRSICMAGGGVTSSQNNLGQGGH